MAIKKIDHISLLTKNPGPVLNFYRNFLGFEIVCERSVPSTHMNIYDLKAREDYIEIIQPTAPEIHMTDGIKHIAFLSDNIDEDFAAFSSSGANLIHKEIQRHCNCAFFFVRSPGGEFIEIIQYL